MSDLSQLREASDRVLYGLKADESLKRRILEKTADAPKAGNNRKFRPVPVFCCAMVMLVVAVLALNTIQPVIPASTVELNVFAAGDKETVLSENEVSDKKTSILQEIDPEDVVAVKVTGFSEITDPEKCASLMNILVNEAIPGKELEPDTQERLIIQTGTGLEISFVTADPYIFGEDCWSCPEFFGMIRQILNK